MYRVIRECSTEKGYGTDEACDLLHASRSAYYKWASGKWSHRITQNEMIAKEVEKIHMESPDRGYRRIDDEYGMTIISMSTTSASSAFAE